MRLFDVDKAAEILHTILDPLATKKLIWLAWDVIFEDCETIDAVEVVRCKDCKHFDGSYPMCCRFEETFEPDGYCSYGEKKEVEE